MYDVILSYIKRPKLTEENKEFYSIRYLTRSLLNASIISFIFIIIFKKRRFTLLNNFFVCYYMGFSLRKLNDILILKETKEENILNTNTIIENNDSNIDV